LAITAWTIPVALIYPPGALIVVPFPVTADHSGIVPTYDAYYTGNDSALGWFDNPTVGKITLAQYKIGWSDSEDPLTRGYDWTYE
jgi:hypothetical protein